MLFRSDEQEAVYIMRKALNGMKADEAVEQILNTFARTRNNATGTDCKETEIFIKSLHFRESYVILSKLFKMEFVN